MKLFFRNIHLYLSLAAGLVIMSCCFSGAVLVFEKELQEGLHNKRYFVAPQALHLPLEQLIKNVTSVYSSAKVSTVRIYSDPKRSVEIGISIENKEAVAARSTYTAFVNPYTGKVLELYNYRETFLFKIFSLHRWLLGSDSGIGKTITGIATLMFLCILVTGIILWWPRNTAILKQRLKIKTDASFKRLNHDLHIVLGFYSAIILFVFASTALAWSFKWFNQGIYTITNSSTKPADVPKSQYPEGKKTISYDSAYITLSKATSNFQFIILRAPSDSLAPFSATLLPVGAHESASDIYYIDQYSGELLGSIKFAERSIGQRIRSTFKPVHVGSIFGLPSKMIAFLVCILGVTFPITGTIMWITRIRKKK